MQGMCKAFQEGRLAVIMAPGRAIDYVAAEVSFT